MLQGTRAMCFASTLVCTAYKRPVRHRRVVVTARLLNSDEHHLGEYGARLLVVMFRRVDHAVHVAH